MSGVGAMTEIEIEQAAERLQRDGYVVFPGVVPPELLAELERGVLDEFEGAKRHGLFEGGGMISGHLNCYPGEGARPVYEAVRDHGIVDVIAAVKPGTTDRLRLTGNLNLPKSYAQHYHSDGLFTEAFLICNVAVVDTDLTNGAIDVLPGTHQRFYKFWQYALGRKYRLTTRIPMRRGDVLIRYSTMWHRGMPNKSPNPRLLMSLTFGEVSAPATDPFTVDGGRPQFTPNWYGIGKVAQARERVFVRAPWLYSTYRFTRSLVGNKGYSHW